MAFFQYETLKTVLRQGVFISPMGLAFAETSNRYTQHHRLHSSSAGFGSSSISPHSLAFDILHFCNRCICETPIAQKIFDVVFTAIFAYIYVPENVITTYELYRR